MQNPGRLISCKKWKNLMNRLPEKNLMVNFEPIWNFFALIWRKQKLKSTLATFEKWYMADSNFK